MKTQIIAISAVTRYCAGQLLRFLLASFGNVNCDLHTACLMCYASVLGQCGLFLVFALLFFSSIPMKAPIIPTQFSLLFSSILQSINGIVSVVSVYCLL